MAALDGDEFIGVGTPPAPLRGHIASFVPLFESMATTRTGFYFGRFGAFAGIPRTCMAMRSSWREDHARTIPAGRAL